MRHIPLSGKNGVGKFTIVDDDDYDMLKAYSWHCTPGGYASGGARAQRELGHHFMHRVVCQTPDGYHTDHINGDRLDNRSDNLRHVTASQNMMNTRTRKGRKYKGIWWNEKAGFWYAAISKGGSTINLGNFRTQYEAVTAYNEAAIEMFGEYAKVNEIQESDLNDKPLLRPRKRRGGKSRYTGVTWHYGGWNAFIRKDGGGNQSLGNFPIEKFAAMVYDAAAIERYGDHAIRHVNFPELMLSPLDLRNRFVFKAEPRENLRFVGAREQEGTWYTRNNVNGKRVFLSFETAEQAAEAYDKHVLLYADHRAIHLNFPEKLARYLSEIGELPTPVQLVTDDLLRQIDNCECSVDDGESYNGQ